MSHRIVGHPLAHHLLTELRRESTDPAAFRRLSYTLSTLLVLEATRDLPLVDTTVATPLEEAPGKQLGQAIAMVPVLRAGLGMLEATLRLFPDVAVGYIGLVRDHTTAVASSYYCKLPRLEDRFVLCADPMLATGGSACQALSLLKENGAKVLRLVTVVSAPQGIERVEEEHPDVTIVTAAVDRDLNHLRYILPGLGDYGDRLYGTL